jgi:hypothetical protein
MVGDPEVGDQGNREVDVHEPGERIFPPPLAQVSQGNVEGQREHPDVSHERQGMMVQENGFPPVGFSDNYNEEVSIGEQRGGKRWGGALPRR